MAALIFSTSRHKNSLEVSIPFGILSLVAVLFGLISISSQRPVGPLEAGECSTAKEHPAIEPVILQGADLRYQQDIEKALLKQDLIHDNLILLRKLYEQNRPQEGNKECENPKNERKSLLKILSNELEDIFEWLKRCASRDEEVHKEKIMDTVQGTHGEEKVDEKKKLDTVDVGTQGTEEFLQSDHILVITIKNYLGCWITAKKANHRAECNMAHREMLKAHNALKKLTLLQRNFEKKREYPVNPYLNEDVSSLMEDVEEVKKLPTKYQEELDQSFDPDLSFLINLAQSTKSHVDYIMKEKSSLSQKHPG